MKPYHILKDFNGSQTGHDFHQFKAGTTSPLSDSLAAIAVGEGWAKAADPVPSKVVTLQPPLTGDTQEVTLPEDRETKVVGPEETKVTEPAETKPAKPLIKMSKAELAAHAMTAFGLELVADEMTAKDMIAAIEAAGNA
ncbi:MAG: hypothetical protein K8U57_30400 [Planctomycetes bacterium]|nr:hypothetical protein [Planctomycetota bacterium]